MTLHHDDAEPDTADRRQSIVAGLRVRRIRLRSAAKMSFVFFAVWYVASLLAVLLLWNVMHWVGFIAYVEDVLTSSLGLDAVSIAGGDLLGLAVFGLGILAVFGFVFTMLGFALYNAAGDMIGGLTLDTTLTRRRRHDRSTDGR